MRIYNLIVHIVTGFVLVIGGVCLFFPGLMTSILSLMFNGNGISILMLLGGAFLNAAGIFSIVMSVINFKSNGASPAQYKSFELIMSGLAIVLALVCILVLLAFHQFSIKEIFKYGYEMFLFFNAAVIAGNLISLILAAVS